MSKIGEKLNNLVAGLCRELTAKQRDVLELRYGLQNAEPLTLQEIGDRYGITRERVRQIEALALNFIRPALKKGGYQELFRLTAGHLKKLGGVRGEAQLYKDFNLNGRQAGFLKFLLEASGQFPYRPEDDYFQAVWAVTPSAYDKAAGFLKQFVNYLADSKEEVLARNSFSKVFNQFAKTQKITPSVADNYFSFSKKFAINYCGERGLNNWSEINPKTARDWAHLILRKEGRPLHFTQLTKMIAKWRENKITNAQTVHNELIKDRRFVLVGRGTYGLKEFNIMPGTAREVLGNILKTNGPLPAKEAVKLALKEREFKPTTLFLNLQNKNHFVRLDDGRYTLREA